MKVALADVNEEGLQQTAKDVVAIIGEPNVLAVPTDVSKFESVVEFRDKIFDNWGEVSVPCSYIDVMSALPPRCLDVYRGKDLHLSLACSAHANLLQAETRSPRRSLLAAASHLPNSIIAELIKVILFHRSPYS